MDDEPILLRDEFYEWAYRVDGNRPRAWLSTAETLRDATKAVREAADADDGQEALAAA